jgi:hypothetical protein
MQILVLPALAVIYAMPRLHLTLVVVQRPDAWGLLVNEDGSVRRSSFTFTVRRPPLATMLESSPAIVSRKKYQ